MFESVAKWVKGLPWLALVLLVIFVDGLVGGLARLGGKQTSSKVVGAILLISFILSLVSFGISLPGIVKSIVRILYIICWIADLITVILSKKFTLFAD